MANWHEPTLADDLDTLRRIEDQLQGRYDDPDRDLDYPEEDDDDAR